jgi:NAD(P)-dependent dehydrogenase (short-subunit alcohol dehydrogenase family)
VTRPVVLVTGGSRGIGAATCIMLAEHGYDVAINYARDADAAEHVAAGCRAAGANAITVAADVASEPDVMAMFQRVDAELGVLSALVNNAGVVAPKSRLDAYSVERIDRLFAVNVRGSLLCAREAVLRMSTLHGGVGGSIVNISSRAAAIGGPGEYVDYAASKAAIDAMTVGLSKEVATEGIRVNAVRPGVIDTDIHASGGQPDRAQRVSPLIPMLRPGTATEIAGAIVWLLSDAASYTTGAILDVGGGR